MNDGDVARQHTRESASFPAKCQVKPFHTCFGANRCACITETVPILCASESHFVSFWTVLASCHCAWVWWGYFSNICAIEGNLLYCENHDVKTSKLTLLTKSVTIFSHGFPNNLVFQGFKIFTKWPQDITCFENYKFEQSPLTVQAARFSNEEIPSCMYTWIIMFVASELFVLWKSRSHIFCL